MGEAAPKAEDPPAQAAREKERQRAPEPPAQAHARDARESESPPLRGGVAAAPRSALPPSADRERMLRMQQTYGNAAVARHGDGQREQPLEPGKGKDTGKKTKTARPALPKLALAHAHKPKALAHRAHPAKRRGGTPAAGPAPKRPPRPPAPQIPDPLPAAPPGPAKHKRYDVAQARAQVELLLGQLSDGATRKKDRMRAAAATKKAQIAAAAKTALANALASVSASESAIEGEVNKARAFVTAQSKTHHGLAIAQANLTAASLMTATVTEAAALVTSNRAHQVAARKTVADHQVAARKLGASEGKRGHDAVDAQANEAVSRGNAKARTFGNDECGEVQAAAVVKTANTVAGELAKTGPDIEQKAVEQGTKLADGMSDAADDVVKSLADQVAGVSQPLLTSAVAQTAALRAAGETAGQGILDLGRQIGGKLDEVAHAAHAQLGFTRVALTKKFGDAAAQAQASVDQQETVLEGTVDELVRRASDKVRAAERPDPDAIAGALQTVDAMVGDAANGFDKGLDDLGQRASASYGDATAGVQRDVGRVAASASGHLHVVSASAVTGMAGLVAKETEELGKELEKWKAGLVEAHKATEQKWDEQIKGVGDKLEDAITKERPTIKKAVDDAVAENRKPLDELGGKLDDAAEEAKYKYEHPIRYKVKKWIWGALKALAFLAVGLLAFALALFLLAADALILVIAGAILLVGLLVLTVVGLLYTVISDIVRRIRSADNFFDGVRAFFIGALDITGIPHDVEGIIDMDLVNGRSLTIDEAGARLEAGGGENVGFVALLFGARGMRGAPKVPIDVPPDVAPLSGAEPIAPPAGDPLPPPLDTAPAAPPPKAADPVSASPPQPVDPGPAAPPATAVDQAPTAPAPNATDPAATTPAPKGPESPPDVPAKAQSTDAVGDKPAGDKAATDQAGRDEATKPSSDKAVDAAQTQRPPEKGPSGKAWDDPSLTEEEFIKDYRARNPKSKLSDQNLGDIYAKGQRLNPESNRFKVPDTEPIPKSEKPWDDPSLTVEEFIAQYRARVPRSKSTMSDEALAEAFAKGQRFNPETNRFKVPRVEAPPGFERGDLPKPGSPEYQQWKQWKPGDASKVPCFPAGTLVHTPSGALPIESLCAGARVLAWDRERGCVESRVLDVHRNYAEELVALATHNGEMFATCSHPYWVVDRASWLRAAHLERGMTLKLVDGSTTEVTRVARVAANEPTFNLTVETYHTYWVSFAGILVHNDEKVSAYADATTYDTKIYRVVNRETGEVVYVGKTDQPLPDRLYQHATKEESALFLEDPADRARFDEIYRIEQVREGRWTTYESNVWEQHQMDVERANGAKLRNRQEGIDWAKGEKYVEMHNPCR